MHGGPALVYPRRVLRIPPVLLGATAAVLLAGCLALGWSLLLVPVADAAGEGRSLGQAAIAQGADYEACIELTRHDPAEAEQRAEAWAAAGGGEGARHCLGLALLALGEVDLAAERLEALAARSLAPAPARAAVFAQAGEAWMLARQPGRAYAAATMGLVLAPEDVELLTDRALALGALGRNAEAVQDLDRILSLAPERVEALVLRATARRRLDRLGEAEADIARALRLDPRSAEALLERGVLRQIRGDTAGARADWEEAAALAPDSPTADLALQNLALSEAGPLRR